MDLLTAFKKNLTDHFSMINGKKLLLAVSGGVDSVVLTDLFFHAGFDFVIAHCNFQLRDAESARDETFVLALQDKYNKPVMVQHFDTTSYAETNKVSVQEAARKLRYDWFEQIAAEHRLSLIVTAHHANDNAETVLMHLFRGTGLKGLTGIPSIQKNIIRPLLPFRKEDLLTYAKENNLAFVEDSSNHSNKYTRNFFRNELIPAIEKVFPKASQNLEATIERLKETETIFNEAIEAKRKRLFSKIENSDDISVGVLELKKLVPLNTWVHELFKPYGLNAAQIPELIKLLDAGNGSYLRTGSFRLIKNRNKLLITATAIDALITATTIDENEDHIKYGDRELIIRQMNADSFKILSDTEICCVDMRHIQFPLLLRKWKTGDYFYPLGMSKKKKLSRFFTDQKLSLKEKENVWVLESNKRIVWVVNYRIDDRFKIKPSTTTVLKIESRML